jgi:hypothetical protein
MAGYKEDQEVQTPRQEDIVQQSEASTPIIVAVEHLPPFDCVADVPYATAVRLLPAASGTAYAPNATSSSAVLAVTHVKLWRQSLLSVPHALCKRCRTHT